MLKYDCRVVRDVMFIDSNGDRSFAPNYLVLITDGRSDNRTLTWYEAMVTRAQEITIIAVSYCIIKQFHLTNQNSMLMQITVSVPRMSQISCIISLHSVYM